MTLRRAATVAALAFSMVVVAGCGAHDSAKSTSRGASSSALQVDTFGIAAGEIPVTSTALFIHGDDAHIDDAQEMLSRVAGVRAVVSLLPKRTRLAQLGLDRLGFDAATAKVLAPLVRRDVVVARSGPGWKLWVSVDGRDVAAARGVAAQETDRAAYQDGMLRVATSQQAWIAAGPDADSRLSGVERWRDLTRSRLGNTAVAFAVGAGRVAAVGVDGPGVEIRGHLATSATCSSPADALRVLGTVASGTTFAAADTSSDGSGAKALRALLDVSTTTVRAMGAIEIGAARVDTIRDALVAGASQLTEGMSVGSSAAQAVGVDGAGGKHPHVVPADPDSDSTLAEDHAFAVTRDATRAADVEQAYWIDLATVIRTAAQARLRGIDLGVTQGVASGIDGVLAWKTCDGGFGARIAIPSPG